MNFSNFFCPSGWRPLARATAPQNLPTKLGCNDASNCSNLFRNSKLFFSSFSIFFPFLPIIPAKIDFDPDSLNLKSEGKWVTVYIELPVGHGYDVSMIDLESVMLNNQVQAEVEPIEIGDYDGDEIPDLMVKFSRTAVQNISNVGDKVEITISGELIDGRLFEGKDTIKVILPP